MPNTPIDSDAEVEALKELVFQAKEAIVRHYKFDVLAWDSYVWWSTVRATVSNIRSQQGERNAHSKISTR